MPTTVEAGLPLRRIPGKVGGAGEPAAVDRAALNAALTGVLAELATRDISALGMQPLSSTPEEFALYLRAEIAKWAPIIRAAGDGRLTSRKHLRGTKT
jgi:tripartite-type tricarboxylate transporter receptor subunit TctC